MSVRNLKDYTDEQLQELADTITEEEFEQLDELSKSTLGSYMAKASDDVADASWRGKKAHIPPRVRGKEGADLKKKRAAGMRTAATKWLNKEENEEETGEELEETAALDSIRPKSVHMAEIIRKMSGMNHDDITKLAGVLNQVGHEADKLPAGANASANKHSIDAKGSAVAGSKTIGVCKEDLINMFGEDQSQLSEEFINKTTTLFEAAVNLRVDVLRQEIFEEAEEIVNEIVEERTAEIVDNLDKYLDTAVNKWIEDNELALDQNIRTVKAEAFIDAFANLLEEHNIFIPEDKEDIVESLMGEVEELKGRLNEATDQLVEANKKNEVHARAEVFDEIAEGLAATQVEKLRALTEGLEASDLDEYRQKVVVVKEQHFKEVKTSNISEQIESKDLPTSKSTPNGSMARYSDAITKFKNS